MPPLPSFSATRRATPSSADGLSGTVDGLLAHPDCRVFNFGRTGFDAALRRYRARPDKTYSLVDCHSMVLMEERRITQVLTADDHFRQAGFTCLLPTAGGPR